MASIHKSPSITPPPPIPAFVLNDAVQDRELAYAVQYAAKHGGKLPNDAFWRYVEERFNYAEQTGTLANFEKYHPVITPLLLANQAALNPSAPTPIVPVTTVTPIMLPLPSPNPQSPVTTAMGPSTPATTTGTPVTALPPVTTTCPPVTAAVPEPSSSLLFGLGLAIVVAAKWRPFARRTG